MDEDEVRELLQDEVSGVRGVLRDDRSQDSVQAETVVEAEDEDEDEEEMEPMDDRITLPQDTGSQRPVRKRKAPELLQPTMKGQSHGSSRLQQHLHVPEEQAVEYDKDIARYAVMLLLTLQHGGKIKFKKPAGNHKRAKLKANLLVNYSLDQGIRKFKRRGFDAAKGEMKQLHDRSCWKPIKVQTLTPTKGRRLWNPSYFLWKRSVVRSKRATVQTVRNSASG